MDFVPGNVHDTFARLSQHQFGLMILDQRLVRTFQISLFHIRNIQF